MRITRQLFDAAGRLVAHWDPRLWDHAQKPNLVTTFGLSGQTLLSDSVDAGWQLNCLTEAQALRFSWDSRGTQHQTEFDPLQRPIAIVEQMANESSLVIERFTYATASDEYAAHNQCGRLVQYDDGAGSQRLTEYDLNGVPLVDIRRYLNSLETPDWPLDFQLREALLEDGEGFVSSERRTTTGELLNQTDAKGNQRTFVYTVAGQLRESRLQLAGTMSEPRLLISDIQYNAAGQIETETAGNGVLTNVVYAADDGRPVQLLSASPSSPPLQDLRYEYDPVGNIIRLEDTAQSVRHFNNQRIDPINRYRYDSLYQLVEASGRQVFTPSYGPALPTMRPMPLDPNLLTHYTQTFDYDAAGNLLSRHHSGAPNFSMKISSTHNRSLAQREDGSLPDEEDITKGFDACGNQLQLQPGQAVSWDGRQQLGLVTMVKREDGPDDHECYRYGRRGQRLRKVRITQTGRRTLRTDTRYLPGLEIHFDSAGGEERHVITAEAGRNRVRLLHWQTAPPKEVINDQLRFSLSDLLGSCTLELDDKAGLLSQEGYYAFGGTAWWAGRNALETTFKTHRYSGKERDATGLYYYGYRYYAPWLQRWMCPDPAGDVDGLNRYLMVKNNPVGFFDEDGLGRTPIDERTSKSKTSYFDPNLSQRLNSRDETSKARLNRTKNQLIHMLDLKNEIQSVAKSQASVLRADSFTNIYERDVWTFEDNYRNSQHPDGSKKTDFFASDVTIHQYSMVSKSAGFSGHLPSIIRRWAVDNRETRRLTRNLDSGSEELKNIFMEKTQNGKSTKEILNTFGLKVIKIMQADNTFDIYVEPSIEELSEYNESSYINSKNTNTAIISHAYELADAHELKHSTVQPRPALVKTFFIDNLSRH
ncbi:RHS repeat domain-containing protein [Pseudomonas sp. PD9R]|uniref:RHS repeat domain-containing protein n=1 Tax=Pseudomonas sp. PD9R TaxID=2853534 RepID=UPI002108A3BF|nr:RHS repeat-associated core domain-containing protein [Pseudomonas sp. PD9R]